MTVKIGPAHDRLTESEEIEVLKAKNGKRTLIGATLEDLSLSYTYGLGLDIWNTSHIDTIFIRDRIQTYFVNLFEWEGSDVTEDFKLELEKILFRHGKVAVVKTPNGDFYPAQFTYKDEDLDFYGNPRKITIVTDNIFNGRIFQEGSFVIINNNQAKNPTLIYALERLRQVTRSIIDVDNAAVLSAPKWGVNMSADDAAIHDVRNAMRSTDALVPLGNIDFTEAGVQNLAGVDASAERINLYQFQLNNLLQLLGLSVNEGNVKAERMSELEVAKGDKFANGDRNVLIQDMFDRRTAQLDKLKELGMDINLEQKEEEAMTQEDVNGELNKAKVGGQDE